MIHNTLIALAFLTTVIFGMPQRCEPLQGTCGVYCTTKACKDLYPKGTTCYPSMSAGGGKGQCSGHGSCWVDGDGEYNWPDAGSDNDAGEEYTDGP
jgi:hypothetical protein